MCYLSMLVLFQAVVTLTNIEGYPNHQIYMHERPDGLMNYQPPLTNPQKPAGLNYDPPSGPYQPTPPPMKLTQPQLPEIPHLNHRRLRGPAKPSTPDAKIPETPHIPRPRPFPRPPPYKI